MAQRISKAKGIIVCLVILSFLAINLVSAATQADFDQILQPLQTIYDLAKYTATIIAGLVMLFAGITYISNGSDPGKRENGIRCSPGRLVYR